MKLSKPSVHAMKGKSLVSIIMDGDLAMKNAIKTVFPSVHQTICLASDS